VKSKGWLAGPDYAAFRFLPAALSRNPFTRRHLHFHVLSNHHRNHNRPDQFSPDHSLTQQHERADKPTRTLRRPKAPHHDGRCLVVPVAVTAGDKIESLRQWASGRCLSADRAGVYSRSEGGGGGRVRRVVRTG
jgi:hypothetical protein